MDPFLEALRHGWVLSPSDLAPGGFEKACRNPVFVGGRLVARDASAATLADALGQLTIPLELPGEVQPGMLLVVEGRFDGQTLRSARLVEALPGGEPRAGSEHARMSWTGRGAALRARARAASEVRAYFAERAFLEVETPAFRPSPGLDPHVHSLGSVQRGDSTEPAWLITSPEFSMKRLLAGGMPRIFEFARCFRAEERGARHEPEFTLLEWYRAFSSYEAVLRDTEQIVSRVVRALRSGSCVELDGKSIDVTPPFERMTVREAFGRFAGLSNAAELAKAEPERYFELLVDRVEPGLAGLGRAVFLTHYPLSEAALARRSPDDPSVAERFELYVGSLELSNGFGELTDPAEQRARFEAERERRRCGSEPRYPLDEKFLAALTEGMPPAAGNALGFDRLIALSLGLEQVALTRAFADIDR